MFRVGIDARTLARENVRGIGRYVSSILTHIAYLDQDVHFSLYYDKDCSPPEMEKSTRFTGVPFRFRGDRWRLWERIGLPWKAWQGKVDILHCPANVVPVWQPVPTVITLHDTMPWDRPEEAGLSAAYVTGPIVRALKRARAVITISQASRADILKRFPWIRRKLVVIPHGIDHAFLVSPSIDMIDRVRENYKLSDRYILYVGGSAPRKRAGWALRLFKEWQKRRLTGIKLAMLGFSEQAGNEIRAEVTGLGLEPQQVVLLPVVPDDLLPALYAESEFVLFPSEREGFGFPALEAQACGRPVLLSRTSSLPEVSGPAARLLDPEDFEAWMNAGLDLLINKTASSLAEPSKEWARQFSWSRAAHDTLRVYQDILEKKS